MTPENEFKIWQAMNAIAEQVKQLQALQSASSTQEIDFAERTVQSAFVTQLHQAAIVAIARTHPNKPEALRALQNIWNSKRGPLGIEGVSDECRAVIQHELDEIAKALGGTIL